MLKLSGKYEISPEMLKRASIVIAVIAAVLLYISTMKSVQLTVDGTQIEIRTHARTVRGVLDDAGVPIDSNDQIWPNPDQPIGQNDTVWVKHARAISIQADGATTVIHTSEIRPENILQEAGLRIFPGDLIYVDDVRWDEDEDIGNITPTRVELRRGIDISVLDGEHSIVIRSAASTLGEALWENGISLREGDVVTPPTDSPLADVKDVQIRRARPVTVVAEGDSINTWATGYTVRDVLANVNVPLQFLDYSIPDLDDEMPADGTIRVVRVQEKIQNELEPIPFETVYQPVEDLEIDNLQVLDSGTYGVRSNRVRIRLEDGEETERIVDGAVVAVEPEPRKIGYGTKIVVRTLNTPSGTIEYWRAVPVYATSYSPCNLGVSWCGSRTASGAKVERGVIGVIRSWYNAMKKWPVYVPSYGIGSIEDIGAGIAGRDWIDLGFTDEEYENWHSWTTLYFLTPVPLPEHITWILP